MKWLMLSLALILMVLVACDTSSSGPKSTVRDTPGAGSPGGIQGDGVQGSGNTGVGISTPLPATATGGPIITPPGASDTGPGTPTVKVMTPVSSESGTPQP